MYRAMAVHPVPQLQGLVGAFGLVRILLAVHPIEMERIELKIDGMHCGACVRRVTALISAVDGAKVESVEIGKTVISGDAPRQELIAAIESGGFTVAR